jgi:LuxR family transcriptional regulator, maltose regulon positive regulatory protein
MQVLTPYNDQLLATKFFIPACAHALISRPRLTALLNAGLQRTLTLLSAPAGFGKTTLLSEWVQSRPSGNPPVAWVSLDEADNDPVRFWTYVLTALDACRPGLCTQLLVFLRAQQAPPLQSVLKALINASLERTEPLLLVLDDYHLITEQAVHTSLSYLVEHLPSHLHMILLTRVDPPLPLSRLRVRGQILELRTDQLRSTPQEGAAFLREVMGIELTSAALQEVVAHTEGWLAGLQLLGLSLQGHADPAAVLNELRGSQRYLLDYLTEEVLEQQPADVQAFLLRTALLERLSAPLCDALMEQAGSQEMLEYLEQANLFVVSLDEHRHWYRYHALFAEALRYVLERSQPTVILTLYHRASEWYAQQGLLNEAVQYALHAHAWERAADLIEQMTLKLGYKGSDPLPLFRWLNLLPPEIIRARAYLCLNYAYIVFILAPPTKVQAQQQADAWLQEAETRLTASLSEQIKEDTAVTRRKRQGQENLLGDILALRALIAGYHGDGQVAFSLCQ